ncbi:MAG: ATP-binding protein, partial [Minisyncoccia bacterium]
MIEFSTLIKFNPWWTTAKVPDPFLGKFERPLLSQIKKYLGKRQMILVYGLRRVGKTTLFYQLIQHLLDQKVNPLNIFYFSFDERVGSGEEIIQIYEEKVLKKTLSQTDKVYLFFDEIQKAENWQEKIKIIYDLNPNTKIFLSGSASVSLQKKSQESLAGRMFDFFLKPLSFKEFLAWKDFKVDPKKFELYQSQLRPMLSDYLRKGGFPEIVNEEEDEVIRNYLKNTVLERIIYKDLPQEFGLKDTELLRILLEMVVREPGMIINFDRLSRDLGRSKITIINYFEYLKYSLLIKEIKNFKPGFLVSSRKGKKAYPANPAFCFALRDDFFQEEVFPKVAELAVITATEGKNYFRNSYEVDLILKTESQILPIEIKYGKVEKDSIKKFIEDFG